MGTFGGILSTGQQALQAHQTALQVTGQNIANANTPGYSRERAELVSALSSHTNILRSGVNVEEITRAYDRFITTQVTVASSNLKSTQTQSDLLGQVEALFNDLNTPEAGLSGALDAFFQGLHDLAQNPQGLSERSSVLQQAENVAEAFHRLADGLQRLSQESNAQLGDAITDVNHLTQYLR
jgi:flagellar hook-associated protein 1